LTNAEEDNQSNPIVIDNVCASHSEIYHILMMWITCHRSHPVASRCPYASFQFPGYAVFSVCGNGLPV